MSNLDELREKLEGFYHRAFTDGMNDGYSPYKWTRELAELFSQYLEQAELKARIYELKKIPVDVHKEHASHTNYCMKIGYRNARIREIEREIKSLTTNKSKEK